MTALSGGRGLRILIVTDAWAPQINGVVRTLETLGRELEALGHKVAYATPQERLSLPMPGYPEIRLALFARAALKRQMRDFLPDAVHIATEGPLGLAARALCTKHGIAFTTAFHTRFPDYVTARFPFMREAWVWRWLRWFHAPALAVMAATPALQSELQAQGLAHVRLWPRGVDVRMFRPIEGASLPYPGPIWLYVGRVTVEKNIEAFLALDLPGTKLVIGQGPARAALEARYPQVHFLGALTGDDLVRHYAASSVFVFPSRTDTFGLVLLEALACGLPVAAYRVQGPLEAIGDAPAAALEADLGTACRRALALATAPDKAAARHFALTRSWRAATLQFLANLSAAPGG